MANQIKKKYILNNAIDGSKIELLNDQALRAKNSSGVSVDLLKLNSADVFEFLQTPEVSVDPTEPNQLARKSYVDNLAQGVAWKQVARAAIHSDELPAYSYDNGLGGIGATITADANGAWDNAWSDGVAVAEQDRVVVYVDGVAGIEFGVYVVTSLGDAVSPWVLTRSLDCDGSPSAGELLGATITVVEGDTHTGTTLRMNTPSPIVVGTTAMLWDHISSGLAYSFGDGLQLAGTDVSVKADAVGGANLAKAISVSANGVAVQIDDSSIGENLSGQLYVKDGGITDDMLASDFLHLSGGVMAGTIDMGGNEISSVIDITGNGTDQVNIDSLSAGIVVRGQNVNVQALGTAFINADAGSVNVSAASGIDLSPGTGMSVYIHEKLDMQAAPISNVADPTLAQDAATKKYVDDLEALDLRLDGSRAMTGNLAMGNHVISGLADPSNNDEATTKFYVDSEDQTMVKLDGSRAMTGFLDMGSHFISNVTDPTNPQDAATKAYVDSAVAGVNSAAEITFTPYGNISATDVQAAIQELDDEKLALAGGTMSGGIDMGGNVIIEVSDIYNENVTLNVGSAMGLSLDSGTGEIEVFSSKIVNLADPTADQHAATKKYVDDLEALDLRLDGSRPMTGWLDMNLNQIENLAGIQSTGVGGVHVSGGMTFDSGSLDMGYQAVNNVAEIAFQENLAAGPYASLTGSVAGGVDFAATGAMLVEAGGDLSLQSGTSIKALSEMSLESHKIVNLLDPTAAQDAATKAYVDSAVAGVNSAAEITFTPYGNIAATDVQAAIQELDDEKLALAGGTMSGTIDMNGNQISNVTNVNALTAFTVNAPNQIDLNFDTETGFRLYNYVTEDLVGQITQVASALRVEASLGNLELSSAGNIVANNTIDLGGNTLLGATTVMSATGIGIEIGADGEIAFSPNGTGTAVAVDYGVGSAGVSRIYDGTGDGLEIFSDGGAIYISSPMGQDIDMNSQRVTNLLAPAVSTDAATKGYVDAEDATFLKLDGTRPMSADLDIGLNNLQNVSGAYFLGSNYGLRILEENFGYVAKSTGDLYLQANAFNDNPGTKIVLQSETSLDGHKIVSLADPTSAQDAATKSYVDGIEIVFSSEKIVLSATDISNGYIDLSFEVVGGSLNAYVDRLAIHETDDYTLSVSGGVTRLTFAGNLVSPSEEEVAEGDIVHVKYARYANV